MSEDESFNGLQSQPIEEEVVSAEKKMSTLLKQIKGIVAKRYIKLPVGKTLVKFDTAAANGDGLQKN